jgi:hypothetical protein
MKENYKNEDQKDDDDGSEDRNSRSEVAFVLSIIHSH